MIAISLALHAILALLSPRTADLATGTRRTAPSYVTADTAVDHALAASVAGGVYGIDPALLLSIGWHESRYQLSTVTREAGGKVSCGVMTPEPTQETGSCRSATASLLGGYLAGARHLRTWLGVCRGDRRCALTGYAGGYALLRLCESDDVPACHTAEI